MKKTLITMTSITYAMKAAELLNSMGYFANVERTPKNVGTGCGYSVRIKNPPQEITAVLEQYDIPYRKVITV